MIEFPKPPIRSTVAEKLLNLVRRAIEAEKVDKSPPPALHHTVTLRLCMTINKRYTLEDAYSREMDRTIQRCNDLLDWFGKLPGATTYNLTTFMPARGNDVVAGLKYLEKVLLKAYPELKDICGTSSSAELTPASRAVSHDCVTNAQVTSEPPNDFDHF